MRLWLRPRNCNKQLGIRVIPRQSLCNHQGQFRLAHPAHALHPRDIHPRPDPPHKVGQLIGTPREIPRWRTQLMQRIETALGRGTMLMNINMATRRNHKTAGPDLRIAHRLPARRGRHIQLIPHYVRLRPHPLPSLIKYRPSVLPVKRGSCRRTSLPKIVDRPEHPYQGNSQKVRSSLPTPQTHTPVA